MTRLRLVAAVAGATLLLGVVPAAQEYRVTGMVLKVDRERNTFVVSHDRITGLMDAMTMPFSVREARELDGLVPGAIVEFTLVRSRETAHASGIRVRRYESVEQDPLNASRLALLNRLNRAARVAQPLAVGQTVPDFTLTNQAHRRVSLSQFGGRVVAVNFLYTSCALPQFCLRSANNFGALQRRFGGVLGRDLVLLTVTFDPVHDSPDVLARYASPWKPDPAKWHFLTGEVGEVRHVCESFGVVSFPNEGLLDHSLRTVLIDRSGRLVANIEGNQFTAGQLGDLVQNVLHGGP